MSGRNQDSGELALLIDACVKLVNRLEAGEDEADYLEWERRLERSLTTIFDTLAALGAEAGWGADPVHPGYVLRVRDGVEVRVPWNLKVDLPEGSALDGLLDLAMRLRTSSKSTICLSGSAAAHRAYRRVGDIDFCEYLPPTKGVPMRKVLQHAASLNGDLCLIRFWLKAPDKGGNSTFCRPWTHRLGTIATTSSATMGKYDFVAVIQGEGVIEVTNLVLARGMEHRSHAVQEVPVGSWVPRQLAQPRDLGRYVLFLRREVEKLLMDGADGSTEEWRLLVKASKRAISLFRLQFLAQGVDELLESLEKGRFLLRAALHARLELWKGLHEMNDAALAPYVEPLSETLQTFVSELGLQPSASAADEDLNAWIGALATRSAPPPEQVEALRERLARGFAV